VRILVDDEVDRAINGGRLGGASESGHGTIMAPVLPDTVRAIPTVGKGAGAASRPRAVGA